MPTFKISRSATSAGIVNTNEETVLTYVNSNPGKTNVEIAAAVVLGQDIVDFILEIWERASGVTGRIRQDGVRRWYGLSGDWSLTLYRNRQQARNWLNGAGDFIGQNNDGNDAAQMATEINAGPSTTAPITEEHAIVLMDLLVGEGTGIKSFIDTP